MSDSVPATVSQELSIGMSEQLKLTLLDPMVTMREVLLHIRVRGMKQNLQIKRDLMNQLSHMRASSAQQSHSRFKDPSVHTDIDFKLAGHRLDALTRHIDAMREKLEILRSISRDSILPRESLPIGIGQTLDNDLMSGDMSVDEYVMQISKLHKSYNEIED